MGIRHGMRHRLLIVGTGLVGILVISLLMLQEVPKWGLYFLSGCPWQPGAPFPSYLYIAEEGRQSIRQTRTVVALEHGTEFIRTYYDQRILLLYECRLGDFAEQNPGNMNFVLIRMDDPRTEQRFAIAPRSALPHSLLHVPEKGLYQTAIDLEDTERRCCLGVSLSTFQQEMLNWDLYKYSIVSGTYGPGVQDPDILFLLLDNNDHVYSGLSRRKVDWQLPASLIAPASPEKSGPRDVITVHLDNQTMRVINSDRLRERNSSKGKVSTLYLNIKQSGEWREVTFDGDLTGVRSFGPWIVGYVSYFEQKESPGKDQRRQTQAETGYPFDWKIMDLKMYFPGILFLYDIRTGKKYTIETNQGDSEILLVEEDIVYYRVNDRILKAKIGKESIGEPELVVEGEVVPDIHWAFMGPEVAGKQ